MDQSEPLQAWGLAQVVEHVAQGLRENTRRHQIFPAKDTDQYRVLSHAEKMAAINSQLDSGDFNARERSIILRVVRDSCKKPQKQA